MTRLGMAENVTAAVKFIEQGHVRVGTEVVTDAAFLVVGAPLWEGDSDIVEVGTLTV